ncbi:MAG: TonB-dependent siderophore receptor [Bdellovibrionia bacterium]
MLRPYFKKTAPILFCFAFAPFSVFADVTLETLVVESVSKSEFWGVEVMQNSVENVELSPTVREVEDLQNQVAAISKSYAAQGYWDGLSIRGFSLDPRNNYYREELAYLGETKTLLANKQSVEVLKGVSGAFSGVSSPGGLLHYNVKRPSLLPTQSLHMHVDQYGEQTLHLDWDGVEALKGRHRFNVFAAKLESGIENSSGQESLLSGASDWQLQNAKLELEWEWSNSKRPSQAGLSLVGDQVPRIKNRNYNSNAQSWSQPVNFENLVSTLRWTQNLSANLSWTNLIGFQQIRTDDYMAFPFGCSAENNYTRFCGDGSFDVYDFRSPGESRSLKQLKSYLQYTHGDWSLQAGAQVSAEQARFQDQTYQYVGSGEIFKDITLPENPLANDVNTNRDQHRTELYVLQQYQRHLFFAFAGIRFIDLNKKSIRTDGSRKTETSESKILPSVTLGYGKTLQTYLSYSEGAESVIVPNKSSYDKKGQALPEVKSQQIELGLKGGHQHEWKTQIFVIKKDNVQDDEPFYGVDGFVVHQGVEFELNSQVTEEIRSHLGVLWLTSQLDELSRVSRLNGKSLVNIPNQSLRWQGFYTVNDRLSTSLQYVYEGERFVTADNKIKIPAWGIWGLSLQYKPQNQYILNLSVENLTDEVAYQESPSQYGHAYLFPLKERRVSAGVSYHF